MQPFFENSPEINGEKSWFSCINRTLDVSKIKKTSPIDMHFHDYIEFLYSFESKATVWVAEKQYKFSSGDFVIINSKEPHDVTYESNSRILCIKFSANILYTNESLTSEFEYILPLLKGGFFKNLFTKEEISKTNINMLCDEIWREFQSKNVGYELFIRANILKIFVSLYRLIPSSHNISYLSEPIRRAFLYLSENYGSANETEVAKICGLSYSYFSTAFKNSVGCSFKDYLMTLKIYHAKSLLLTSDTSISEIGNLLGFSTTSHFIDSFKKRIGETPGKFRKRQNSKTKKT